MDYFEQSPEIKHNGEKWQSPHGWGKAIRTHELEAAINCCLGQKDFAMAKIMYFLTGNAEGFRVSEKTILRRCNISESGYKKARKKLAEKKWIFHQAGEYIQVNFNKIFSDYRALEAGCPQEPSQKIVTVDNEKSVSNPSEVSSVQATGNTEKTEGGIPQNTYNNINNIIRDNIVSISDKGSRCEDTPSTMAQSAIASGVSSQPLRENHFLTREEKKKIEKEFTSWLGTKLRWIEIAYDLEDSAEIKKMMESDEYKAILKEADERRAVLKEEFGDDLRI